MRTGIVRKAVQLYRGVLELRRLQFFGVQIRVTSSSSPKAALPLESELFRLHAHIVGPSKMPCILLR
jgi:hypothetical protein